MPYLRKQTDREFIDVRCSSVVYQKPILQINVVKGKVIGYFALLNWLPSVLHILDTYNTGMNFEGIKILFHKK